MPLPLKAKALDKPKKKKAVRAIREQCDKQNKKEAVGAVGAQSTARRGHLPLPLETGRMLDVRESAGTRERLLPYLLVPI